MQYAKAFTDALQFMWGDGFLSPGGPAEVAQMLADTDLTGLRVLDIGSGMGGIDVLLAERHKAAEVTGIDVEEQLVEAARARVAARGLDARVRFALVAPGPLPFPDARFDVVFSKDAMVHIPDKAALYAEVLRVLVPGGRFVAADWLWSPGAEDSAAVREWMSGGPLKFAFTTVAEAEADLRAAGFADVRLSDERAALQISNREEIAVLEGPAQQKLAAIVGPDMARARAVGARGRQRALDEGWLIPSHIFARAPR